MNLFGSEKMDLEQIIRHDFRVPVSDADDISIKVDGREYEMINLSNKGIGIRFNPLTLFKVGDVVRDIELMIAGQRLLFEGKVVHVSRLGQDYLGGIDLLDMDEKSAGILLACVNGIRTRLFQEK